MTTAAENETLVRVGPGTPMGTLFRRFWIPATLSERLPEPEGAPLPLQLLHERLVAFRDADGKVHVVDEFCPHRRASLAYARCEDGGLRCIFHGWLVGGDGDVWEAPPERHPERFAKSVKHPAYPTHEAGGLVWVYLGEPGTAPPFPDYLFTSLPDDHVYATHYLQECNYLQGIEADVDLVHSCYLHSSTDSAATAKVDGEIVAEVLSNDGAPRPYAQDAEWGFWNIWEYRAPADDQKMVWIHPFLFPCFTVVAPSRADRTYLFHAWVPIDDEHHYFYFVHYNHEQPLVGDLLASVVDLFGHDKVLKDDEYRCVGNLANRHLQDRGLMADGLYSGIRGIAAQDIAVLQSMQPIVDRTKEHLGSEDATVRWLRKRMLAAAREAAASGAVPAGIDASRGGPIQGSIVMVDRDQRWGDTLAQITGRAAVGAGAGTP